MLFISFNIVVSGQNESFTAIDTISIFNKQVIVKNYDNETVTIQGKQFRVFETDNKKLLLVSKSYKGKKYPIWMGEYNKECDCRKSASGKKNYIVSEKKQLPSH
jgi:hypothetical protein